MNALKVTGALKTHILCTVEAQRGWGQSSRIRQSKVAVMGGGTEMTLERWVGIQGEGAEKGETTDTRKFGGYYKISQAKQEIRGLLNL